MDSKSAAYSSRNGNADAALRAACWNDPIWVTWRLLHGSPYDADIYNSGPRSDAGSAASSALENAAISDSAPVIDGEDIFRSVEVPLGICRAKNDAELSSQRIEHDAGRATGVENSSRVPAAEARWSDPQEAVRRLCGGPSKWNALFVGTDPLERLNRAVELDRMWARVLEETWDPAKHPRDEGGRFTETSNGGTSSHSTAAASEVKFRTVGTKKTVQGKGGNSNVPRSTTLKPGDINPGHRTPTTGTWTSGVRGVGEWKPEKPIQAPKEIIESVPYDQNGSPILDKWSTDSVNIILSGNRDVDEANAKKALGKKLEEGYTFHHDARSMKVVRIGGKEAIVGRMQVVPTVLNEEAKHVGSYKVATSFLR